MTMDRDELRASRPMESPLAPSGDRVLELVLRVDDAEVVEFLEPVEGEERQARALTALRIGVLALRQAATRIDREALQDEGSALLRQFKEAIDARAGD